MFDPTRAADASRLPVSLLRTGNEPLALPLGAADLARRHGERWLFVDASHPQAHVRGQAAPPAIWLCRRGRVQLLLDDVAYTLEAGQYLVTEGGARIEAVTPPGREQHWGVLLLPPRTSARAFERVHGSSAADPLLFAEFGLLAQVLEPLDLERLDRALAGVTSDPLVADTAQRLLYRIVTGQREHDAAVLRTSGRTLRHQRHLYARLHRVRHLLLHGPVRDYSMRELADVASLSVWHFVRSFGQVFGETPHRFLTRTRLERAASLLAQTSLSIAAIAERLGFENRCAFARLYRAHFGVPASVHRRGARGAANVAEVAPHTRAATVVAHVPAPAAQAL